MDNQSFDDLGFHPEGGFTFDDLYGSNAEPKENPTVAKNDEEKARMAKEVYGDLPNAEDLFGISSKEEEKPQEEPKVEEEVKEEEPKKAEEPVAQEQPAAPVYQEPVTISYGEDVSMPEEPDFSTENTTDFAEETEEEIEEDDNEVEEVEDSEDFGEEEAEDTEFEEAEEVVEDSFEIPSEPVASTEPAIDKILPDAYPINNNVEETVEEPVIQEEPTFDILTPHQEETDFDGLDEFSRSILMGARPAPVRPEPEVTPVAEEPELNTPAEEVSAQEEPAPVDTFGAGVEVDPAFDIGLGTTAPVEGKPETESDVEDVEDVQSIDDIEDLAPDMPITIADPVVIPGVEEVEDETVTEEPEKVEEIEEVSSPIAPVSLDGLHKDNVKKLNKAFAEFKEDMLRKDMESIFYGANEIMSKEAILYAYMGNEYTETQEKAIADIDGYRFLNDVYEKSVEIKHDSEEKGVKQEFPETISLALANVVDTNEYLYNIRNGAEF